MHVIDHYRSKIIIISAEAFAPLSDVHIESIDSNRLVFTWSSVNLKCLYIQYIITSTNCGACPKVTNTTSVSCLPSTNILCELENCTCMFAVQTEICGSILQNSSDYVILNLYGKCKHQKLINS